MSIFTLSPSQVRVPQVAARRVLSGLALTCLLATTAAAIGVQERSLVVEALLSDRELGAVRSSPDGAHLVVEIMRPRTLPGRVGGLPQARSDLWLVEVASGATRRLTSGEEDGSAAWAAIWSPDSRTIAYLTNAGDGQPRAAWMDIASLRNGLLSQDGVDLEVNFGTRNPHFGDGRFWGAWTSPDSFVTALLAAGQVSPPVRNGVPELVYPPLWEKARRGGTSAVVWDSQSRSYCATDTRLVSLGLGDGSGQRSLLTGSIRAVTISPDRRQATAVVATGALPPPKLGKFDNEFTFQNLDPRVRTELSLVDLGGSHQPPRTLPAPGFRFQSDDDAPRWTRASNAVYAPRFEWGDGAPSNLCVESVRTDGGAPWPVDCSQVRSRRHAQLLALSLSVSPPHSARDVAQRTGQTSFIAGLSSDFFGRDIAIFPLGPNLVGVVAPGGLRLVDLKTGRSIDRLELKGASVLLSGRSGSDAASAVLRDGADLQLLEVKGARLSLGKITPPSPSLEPAGYIGAGDGFSWIERSAQGQALWVSDNRGKGFRKLVTLDHAGPEAFRRFGKKALHYTLPNGKPALAMLLLPPDYDESKPYPVILDVYPFQDYREGSLKTVFERGALAASQPDIYALAERGYVIARPSLPNFTGQPSDYEPLQHYTAMMERFAEEAIKAKLTSPGRIGLWGHSNGGYLALAAAARTKLIGAVVAYSPFSDLQSSPERPALSFSPDACAPNRHYGHRIAYAEDPQGPFWKMAAPTHAARERYVRNSPIYNLGAGAAPTMIVQGEFDTQGTVDSERVYTILDRQDVPVQLARYWGEGHSFESPDNIRDRVNREIEWFDKHLSPAPPRGSRASR